LHLNAFPKPISYYQSPNFEGERGQPVTPDVETAHLTLLDADDLLRGRIISQLQTIRFRRSGRLIGQYVVMAQGLLAVDVNGVPIKLNIDPDDDWANLSTFSQIERHCISLPFIQQRDAALENWDGYDAFHDLPVLSEPFASNYYHFTISFLPKFRHFADAAYLGIPRQFCELPFQRELIGMTASMRRITPLNDMVKVEDPILVHEPFSCEALDWLRSQVGLRARKGNRLIYISRLSTLTGRRDGTIAETEEFNRFLREFNFETIDFGAGEKSVAEQIAMLDGAKVVLSVHGANLTNMAYAESGISVIEMLPYSWSYFSNMQIALAVPLNYFGIVCHQMTEHRQWLVNVDVLRFALQEALRAA